MHASASFRLALTADEQMAATLFEVISPVADQRGLVHKTTAGMAALVRQFSTEPEDGYYQALIRVQHDVSTGGELFMDYGEMTAKHMGIQ